MAQQQLQEKQQQFDAQKAECNKTNKTYFAKRQCQNIGKTRIVGHETSV
jgi:hypothetical protein